MQVLQLTAQQIALLPTDLERASLFLRNYSQRVPLSESWLGELWHDFLKTKIVIVYHL